MKKSKVYRKPDYVTEARWKVGKKGKKVKKKPEKHLKTFPPASPVRNVCEAGKINQSQKPLFKASSTFLCPAT